jgi:lipoprotein-releasing system permease protein
LRPFELFVGLRYTRAKRRTHFISFISFISIAGIALGIWALITVMSVMNGFEKEIRARILGAAAHIQVLGAEGGVADWKKLADEVGTHPEVVASAPFVNAQGLLSTGTAVRGVFVRGVVPELEDKVADFAKAMRAGQFADLRPGEFGIAIGTTLARGLRLNVGDKVTLISPQGQVTPAGLMPRLKQFTVVGIFQLDHNEFDSALALVHMRDAQVLYRMGDTVSGIRLRVKDIDRAPQVARELVRKVTSDVYLSDWTQQNVNYFRAIQIEKRMMFIILTLIIAVAAFNLVSTLVMVVTDKHPDIAIMRTLGASPGQHHEDLHGAGLGDRHVRDGDRRGRRHRDGAQHRRDRPGDRARVQLPDPLARGVLHQRAAFRPASGRSGLCGAHVAGTLVRGDPLSQLARRARQPRRGVAL